MPDNVLRNSAEKRQSMLFRCLLISAGSALLMYSILRWFDTTTELIPDHSNVLEACFLLGGLGAMVAAAVAAPSSSPERQRSGRDR